jgi:ATP-dependent RNA helicase RhlE
MNFVDLKLNKSLLNALEDLGYHTPTTIQQKAMAPIMAGKDVLGIAQTGTGKTFAYLLPILQQWKYDKKRVPQIMIIVPTRELVMQVVEEAKKLAQYMSLEVAPAYGGANIKTQMAAIAEGVDMVVGTPGRLMDLMLNGSIRTTLVKKLVIDEVDEMLNLGFRTQIKNIMDLLPVKHQTLMFSATITEEVEVLIDYHTNELLKIEAAPTGTPLEKIRQMGYQVPNFNTKINLMVHLLKNNAGMKKVLIFAGSKRYADLVNARMETLFPNEIAVIHGNKSQNTRFKTVEQFESGACRILIASDLISRGLDISAVSHVINMDVPHIPENYIHRIGRTGRADQSGEAITLISPADHENQLQVEALMGMEIPMLEIPEEVEISPVLIPDEQPTIKMKILEVKRPKVEARGKSHHEKKEKNKKVNKKVSREDKKKAKYGKKYKKEYRN